MMDDYDNDDESPSMDDELSFPQKNNGGGNKGGGSCRRKCCIFLLLGSASMGVLYGLTEIYDIPILDQLGGALNYNDKSGEIGNNANNEKSQDALNGNKTHSPGLNEWQQKMKDKTHSASLNEWQEMMKDTKHLNKLNFTHGGFHNNGAWAHRANKTKSGDLSKFHKGNNGGGKGTGGDTVIGSEQINSHGSVDKQLPEETIHNPSNNPKVVDESTYGDWLNAPISKSDGVMFEVVGQMEHDPSAFTQGLTYSSGVLYESTGLYGGKSSIRKLDPQTGKALQIVKMDPKYFGEGMAFVGGLLVQITWKEKKGFLYASNDLEKPPIEFDYETTNGEGWGITYDPTNEDFIVSDGTHNLHFWKFTDLGKTQRKVAVMRQDGSPAKKLNELEFWRGRVIANVWFEDVILVINPETGVVEKEYDFKTLWPKTERPVGTDVLNGISVSEDPDVLYITGKKWNRIYRVKLLAGSPESMVPEVVDKIDEPDNEAAPGEMTTNTAQDSSALPDGSSATTETNSNHGTSESSEPLEDDDKNLSNGNGGVQGTNTPSSSTDPNASVVVGEEDASGIPVDPNSATSIATPENTAPGQQINTNDVAQTETEQEQSEQVDAAAIPVDPNSATSTATPENTAGTQHVNTNGVPETATKQVPSGQVDAPDVPMDQNSATSIAMPENTASGQPIDTNDVPQTITDQEPSEQVDASGIPVDPNSATSTATPENTAGTQQVNTNGVPETATEQVPSGQVDTPDVPMDPNSMTSTAIPENTAGSQQVNTNGVSQSAAEQQPNEQLDASGIPVDTNSVTATQENAASSQQANPSDVPQSATEQLPSEQVDASGIPADSNSVTSTATAENTVGSQHVNTNDVPQTTAKLEPSQQVDASEITSEISVDQNSATSTATPETAGNDVPQTATEQELSQQVDASGIPVIPNSETSTKTPEKTAGSQQVNTSAVPETATEQDPSEQADTSDVLVDKNSATSTANPENTSGSEQVNTNDINPTEQEPSEQVDTTDILVDPNSVTSTAIPEDTAGSQQVNTNDVPQTAADQEPSQQQVDTSDVTVDQNSATITSTATPENTAGNQQVNANDASQTAAEQEPSNQVETLDQNSVTSIATPENTPASQQITQDNDPQTTTEQGLIANDGASEIPVNKEVEATIETPNGNVISEANDSLTQSSQHEQNQSGIQIEKELEQVPPTKFNEVENEVEQMDAIEKPLEEVELPVEVETADAGGDKSLEWNQVWVSKSDGVKFEVIRQLEHDPKAFTQGLTYANGVLYESTGLYRGKSSIRKLDPETGKALQVVNMEAQYFGEGMTYYDGKLIQITWQKQVGFVYNADNLEEPPTQFEYDTTNGEGWGITYDSAKNELIVTDGTNFLHFWDPNDLGRIKRKVPVVRQNGEDALKLNELEFWRGRVIANVWYEDVILVINPETGVVEKEYDFKTLWPSQERTRDADCLNGISISEDPDILYVTGKQWDRMYLVRLLA